VSLQSHWRVIRHAPAHICTSPGPGESERSHKIILKNALRQDPKRMKSTACAEPGSDRPEARLTRPTLVIEHGVSIKFADYWLV
jgi:hypothetical protein